MPSGKHDLDASVVISSNPPAGYLPGDQLIGMLVDPYGQLAAYDSNFNVEGVSAYLNLYKANPMPGKWQLVLDWAQPTTGDLNSINFDVGVEFNQVSTSSTLPDSSSTMVSKASGADFTVTVNNTGLAPMVVSPDARLHSSVALALSDVFGSPLTQSMPDANNGFYVPTETSSFNEQVAGSVPMTFDTSSYPGDPDISPTISAPYVTGSLSPTLASVTYAPPSGVTSGLWNSVPAEFGPYAGTEPAATETTTATATTLAFDSTVSSAIPDTVESLAVGGPINPDVVDPGTSDTFTVHIAPTGTVGSVQSGTLFITGLSPGSVLGVSTIVFESLFTSDLAAIPYQYKVGS